MKTAQISHSLSLRTNVLDIQVSQKPIVLVSLNTFEYVVIEYKMAIILTIPFNVKVGQ